MTDSDTGSFTKADVEAAAAAAAKAAAEAATAPLLAQIDDLRTKLAAAPAPKTEAKTYTRAEINAAVARGDITEAEGEAVWDRQQDERTQRLAREAAANELKNTKLTQTIEEKIGDYSELAPKAFVAGTPENQRVKKQYDYLVGIGQPANKSTELAALSLALGDIDGLRAASRGALKRETFEDVGNGDADDVGEGSSADGPPKGMKLTARERTYYQQKIDRGIYPNWKAVEAERKFAVARSSRVH